MTKPVPQKKILLVDDDGDFRKVVSEYLEEHGFYVATACSGKCAVKMFEKLPPDLALVDVILPDMSGLEICKWMKKENQMAKVPVIIISGKTDLQNKLKGFMSGAERYLCKPFLMEDLGHSINALLQLNASKHVSPETPRIPAKIHGYTRLH